MSSSDNNITYKKTSFLAGSNSEFINEFYADYISDPSSLPESWKNFFDGLSENEKLIYDDIKGPSWSPEKKLSKIIPPVEFKESNKKITDINTDTVKQASKDSVRAIMLIRAYRIRGHLIANLDPLSIQKKEEHLELKPESYGFEKKDYNRKIFLDGVLGLQYANLNQILKILKKTYSSNIGYEFMHMGDPDEKSWITTIDHIAITMDHDQSLQAALLHKSLLNLVPTAPLNVLDPSGLVRSQVFENSDRGIAFTINSSSAQRTVASQTLRQYSGSGVNHIAFRTADIFKTAEHLKNTGVEIMDVTDNYYDDLLARFNPKVCSFV